MNWQTWVVLAILLVLVVLAGRHAIRTFVGKDDCCGGSGSCDIPRKKVKAVKVADKDMTHYPYHEVLSIGGMSCAGCAENVQNALNAIEGTWARVDLVSRTANVLSKQPIDDARLEAAVSDAGYRVIRV
ncbi:MAG: heavy-metal-associated domain-containing protein [Coriobacteriia bacterium]|nr:heavy-metal-associated domain-containing protein [Coriobacteriia bacterium]MBS5477920.1 heavy-metal-associated domain-containing protein [Coriobacteriia bacterium]